jgi:hypothetical protein
MPFSLRSIALFSSLIAASLCGSVVLIPVVTPLRVLAPAPDDWAVPAELVPGAGGEASLEELPAPLGSPLGLLNPPGLAGPDGTPLTPDVPAPPEPAAGEPAALPLPADDPLVVCANEVAGDVKIMIAATATVAHALLIVSLLLRSNDSAQALFLVGALFLTGTISVMDHCPSVRSTPGADGTCAN